jgi:hypothetical protein
VVKEWLRFCNGIETVWIGQTWYNGSMEQTRKRAGRPPGRKYERKTSLYLTREDDEVSRRLADHWHASISDAFRRAMWEAAKREKVT